MMNDLFMKKYYASVESHDGTQSFHAERIQVKSIQLLCVNIFLKSQCVQESNIWNLENQSASREIAYKILSILPVRLL